MKTWLGIIGGILVLGLVAGGSFYGGMQYQRTQTENLRNAFFAQRGGTPGPGGNGFFGGGTPGPGGQGFGRGANGQIKAIDGNTLTISTPQREVKVTLTDTTQVEKLVAGDRTELVVGATVVVRGETDSAGNITATIVQVTTPPSGASQ